MARLGFIAIAAMLGLAALPAAGQTPPIPIERFAELPFFESPVLSPDGTRIAALVTVGEQQRVGIWTIGPDGAQQLRGIPAAGALSYQWAGDNRLLITVTTIIVVTGYSVALPVPVRRVVSYDLATGRALALGPGGGLADEIVYTDPGGRYVLLAAQRRINEAPSVYRVDLATGESTIVQPSRRGVWSWFADGAGNIRVGVDYGERRTKIYYRSAPEGELRLVDSQRVVRDESVVDLIRFVENTERGIIVTNAETGRFAVYHYDFATDTRGDVIFEHPEVDVSTPILSREGGIDGVLYEDDKPRLRWFNPELARVQEAIDRTFRNRTNLIVNRSRDGNRMLIYSSAADDPGTYYVYDRAAARMETFGSPFDSLDGIRFAPVRPVSYRSRDGLTIHGYLTLPPGRPERGLPLVVLPHGGPFLRDGWHFDQEVQFLASRGYAVLQPNFRGSTGYGRDFVERGYGQLGTGMIDDVDDGVDWLASQGIIDRGRVCIMGASYGGYAAVWGAMRSPERYRCAISFAGVSDLRTMVRYDTNAFIPRRYVRAFRDRIEGEERMDLDSISPLRQAARLSVPLLISHGENDTNVPPDHTRRLVAALARRRATVESVFYPKAAHGFNTAEERTDWLRRVEAFLARYNPAAAPPANDGR